jgi:hypothetical protein
MVGVKNEHLYKKLGKEDSTDGHRSMYTVLLKNT